MRPAIGFYGKLPARGDFVRNGLPGGFVAAWDGWLQAGLAAARAALGEDWDAAWLEAPVWRFAIPPGHCGPAGALGLWMPSVDAVGRYFPLTLAAVWPDEADPCAGDDAWLDGAEQIGRDALADDLAPEQVTERLAALGAPDGAAGAGGRWWTDGGPYVPAGDFMLGALPDADRFICMLRAPQAVP